MTRTAEIGKNLRGSAGICGICQDLPVFVEIGGDLWGSASFHSEAF